MAQRYSTRPEVCPPPGVEGLKGQRFEAEAYKLWRLQNLRASLTSVQALSMLSWRAAGDGRDRQGRSLFREAAALSHEIRLHKPSPQLQKGNTSSLTFSERRLERGRAVTAWAIRNWSVYVTKIPLQTSLS